MSEISMSENKETVKIPKDKWDSICQRLKKQDETIAKQAEQLKDLAIILNAKKGATRSDDSSETLSIDKGAAHIKNVFFADNLIVEFSDKTAAILPVSSGGKNAIRADLLTAVLVHNLGGYGETAKRILQQTNEIADIYSKLLG